MIDRDGEYSPTRSEQPVAKERLLSEATFLEFARGQMESSNDEVSAVRDLVGVVTSGKMNMRVSNLRDGITYPILDYIALADNEEKATATRRHKENVLNLIDVRRSIEKTAAQSNDTVVGSMRETYYNLTKSMVSAIGTVIKPIFKAAGFLLFGTGKKERTAVQAIDDQTRFMRTGFIEDTTTMFGRLFRRGLVGSAVAGVFTGITGIGRGSSQSVQDKRSRGEELNFVEKATDRLSVLTGWFTDINKKDTRAASQESNYDIQQVELLKGVKDATNRSNFLTEKIVMPGIGNIISAVAMSALELGATQKASFKLMADAMEIDGFRQSNLLEDMRLEMKEVNSPLMSQYEQESLSILKAQNEQLLLANEIAEENAESGKETSGSGGGLIGTITGLIFNRKTMGAIKGLGKRFIITPIIGAIKAGGSWIMKNGFKLLLRAPFAKVFTITAVVGLFTKYLLRPMIDWFDTTFGTSIGESIDKANQWIADKFYGIIDWIREKASKIPVIGKLFKSDDSSGSGGEEEPVKRKPETDEKGFFKSIVDKTKDVFTSEKNETITRPNTGNTVTRIDGSQIENRPITENNTVNEGERSIVSTIMKASPIGFLADKIEDLVSRGEEKRIVPPESGKGSGVLSSLTKNVSNVFNSAMDTVNVVKESGASYFSNIASEANNSPMIPDFGMDQELKRATFEQRNAAMEQLEELRTQNRESKDYSERMIRLMKQMVIGTEAAAASPLAAAQAAEDAKRREQMLKMSDN